MARIAGVNIPREKRIEIGLTYIYGIGRSTANKVLAADGHQPRHVRARPHRGGGRRACATSIEKTLIVEGDLRRERSNDIKRLMEIGCYRGLRHRRGLPVRGQRTKTNARTRKGPKRTVGKQRKS